MQAIAGNSVRVGGGAHGSGYPDGFTKRWVDRSPAFGC